MVKNLPADAGYAVLIPGSGRSPGRGNGNTLQYSYQENLMDRGIWQATLHGVSRVGHNLVTKERERESFPIDVKVPFGSITGHL